jgi:hypothetical protein
MMARTTFTSRVPAGAAMRSLIDGAEQQSAEPAPAPQRSLEVGAADDRVELQADAIAAQVLDRIGTPERHSHGPGCGHGDAVRRAPTPSPTAAIGAAGGELDGESTGQIEAARGGGAPLDAGVRREMESGFGRSLGDVRIHTDARADQLSRQMSARAFTTGRDIFFGKGEYDPTSAAGRHTLAHELAHTTQDSGATRRKMRGTTDALTSQGGGETSGKFRKVIGFLTNWDSIVTSMRKYEALEAQLLSNGNPSQTSLNAAKPGLLKVLKKTQAAIKDWKSSNDAKGEDKKQTKKIKENQRRRDEGEEYDEDQDVRSKSGRRQAVAMLEPRVSNEVSLLSAKDGAGWLSSLGLSSEKVKSTGATKSGQVNKVSELTYETEGGTFTGYFKEDNGFAKSPELQEQEVGITHQDPNYGARSVALYRLDQLFDAGVTARAEFAVHKNEQGQSRLGTVLESAKGTAAGDLAFKLGSESGEGVSIDDPVLQSGLNKLQLLDAIAGQLDRHQGNYHIQQGKDGKVTGVTGIDLDMAFGKDMKTTTGPQTAMNYKGLPEFIDKQMGEKILQVKPTDIRNALLGLLSKAEVEATVSRFTEVQEAVRAAKKSGKIVDKWDGTTSKGSFGSGTSWEGTKSYQEQAAFTRGLGLHKEAMSEATYLINQRLQEEPWAEMPPELYKLVRDDSFRPSWEYKGRSNTAWVRIVADYATDNDLPLSSIGPMMELIVDGFFTTLDANSIAVEFQTAFTGMDKVKISDRIRKNFESWMKSHNSELLGKFASMNKR